MKHSILIIFLFFSTYTFGQQKYDGYKVDNSSKCYSGKIASQWIYMYFELSKDSTFQGYYHYDKYNENIKILGSYRNDSIYIFEFDKNSNKVAVFKGVFFRNSTLGFSGFWYSLLNNKKFSFELHEYHVTGDICSVNEQNHSLILDYNNEMHKIPISRYLDNRFNYIYSNLYNERLNGKFYSIFTFTNIVSFRKGKSQLDETLMYVKFNSDGIIDTVQTFRIKSDNNNIINNVNYGSLGSFKDSINIDIYRLNEEHKINLTISRAQIEKGIQLTEDSIIIFPCFLFDTLKLNKNYVMIIRYKCDNILEKKYYSYEVDTVFEKDNKDISELSNFCNDLRVYKAVLNESKITFGDYHTLQFDDYNFDGYNDIYIYNYEEAGVNNRSQTIWTYNPKIKKYEKNTFLSNLSIWNVDKNQKTIKSGWRTGAQIYNTVTYKLVNGKFVQVETEESYRDDTNNTVTIIKSKLINNKWVKEKKIY